MLLQLAGMHFKSNMPITSMALFKISNNNNNQYYWTAPAWRSMSPMLLYVLVIASLSVSANLNRRKLGLKAVR